MFRGAERERFADFYACVLADKSPGVFSAVLTISFAALCVHVLDLCELCVQVTGVGFAVRGRTTNAQRLLRNNELEKNNGIKTVARTGVAIVCKEVFDRI